MSKYSYHLWTKKEIRTPLTLWDEHTLEEIATKLGVRKTQAASLARMVRKATNKLPLKRREPKGGMAVSGFLLSIISS